MKISNHTKGRLLPERYFSDLTADQLKSLAANIGRQRPQNDYLSKFTWVKRE